MLDLNRTRAGRAGRSRHRRSGAPPPRHFRLFGITALTFLIIYAVICAPITMFYAGSLPTHWPGLLVPATPFVAVLGAWKLIIWFGLRRVAIVAVLTVVAATLSHPFWLPVVFDWSRARTLDDWVGMFVVASGLAGWLMATLALLIAPVRAAMEWRSARRLRRARARNERRVK